MAFGRLRGALGWWRTADQCIRLVIRAPSPMAHPPLVFSPTPQSNTPSLCLSNGMNSNPRNARLVMLCCPTQPALKLLMAWCSHLKCWLTFIWFEYSLNYICLNILHALQYVTDWLVSFSHHPNIQAHLWLIQKIYLATLTPHARALSSFSQFFPPPQTSRLLWGQVPSGRAPLLTITATELEGHTRTPESAMAPW